MQLCAEEMRKGTMSLGVDRRATTTQGYSAAKVPTI